MRLLTVLVCLCSFGLEACEADDESRVGGNGGEPRSDSDSNGEGDGYSTSHGGDSDSETVSGGVGCDGIDLLFIVDDSQSMTSVKANLVKNLPEFVDVLDEYNADKGGGLIFRVAVTSASVDRDFITKVPNSDLENPYATSGDDGVFLGEIECGLSASWIEGPGPDFSDQFTCLADMSTDQTTNIEMPFAAIEAALGPQSETGMPNAGFYTKHGDHLLVVVIITNEEDCSIEDGGTLMFTGSGMCDDDESEGLYSPEKVAGFLDDATGGEGRYVLVGIAGPGPGKCESEFGQAWEALRIRKTIDSLGDYGVFGSICESDLWTALETALNTIKTSCDSLPPVV